MVLLPPAPPPPAPPPPRRRAAPMPSPGQTYVVRAASCAPRLSSEGTAAAGVPRASGRHAAALLCSTSLHEAAAPAARRAEAVSQRPVSPAPMRSAPHAPRTSKCTHPAGPPRIYSQSSQHDHLVASPGSPPAAAGHTHGVRVLLHLEGLGLGWVGWVGRGRVRMSQPPTSVT